MRHVRLCLLTGLAFGAMQIACAQGEHLSLPKAVNAGASFSIESSGNGKATIYILGPGGALKRDLQLGQSVSFAPGVLSNAGHYLAILAGDSFTETATLEVVPVTSPANLTFLARPSRLPVALHDGITGSVYVFDSYHNMIVVPLTVSFELTPPSGMVQKRMVQSHDGAAWTAMDSTGQQGADKFIARIGEVFSNRIVGQVPGDPCGLKMNARLDGPHVKLTTDPVRDCNGNAVPDGTIVTFTETYAGGQSTIDEPLKHGFAEVTMQPHAGATFSVASGVVMGNQIGWGK